MKKQFILPILALVLSVGGAFASSKFAAGYYAAGDDDCSTVASLTPQCTLGNDSDCTNLSDQPYYTKLDKDAPISEENPCEIVRREGFSK